MKYFVLLMLAAPPGGFANEWWADGEKTGIPPLPPALVEVASVRPLARATASLHSIGDPTPEEQLYLELINRARANPVAEATRLATTTNPEVVRAYADVGVDLDLMQTQVAALPPAQPLALNASLTTAARKHSLDMLNNVFQEHVGSDGSTLGSRLQAVGYVGSAGENIYSNAKSVEHGHAAFEVDWGGSAETGWMQSPPGHRLAIHNSLFREVGIGVISGSNSAAGKNPVGPQLVTQDFGVQQNATPMITGVVYYDLNQNNFYDIGEGIGNVGVTVTPANYEAITTRSGGYAVPVPGNGSYLVAFSGSGFTAHTQTVAVAGSRNQKLDFVPAYNPPAVSGPVVATVGRSNPFSISAVAGATDYEWRSFQKIQALPEGGENGSERIVVAQSSGYDVFQSIRVQSGAFAFHLTHPDGVSPAPQLVTLSPTFLLNESSALSFQSRLVNATPYQRAQVQISTNRGVTWQVIYDQPGPVDPTIPSGSPEAVFTKRSLDLQAFAGNAAQFRFAYLFIPPSNQQVPLYTGNNVDLGWLFDGIEFTSTQEVINEEISSATNGTIQFTPETVGDFSLQARARTGHEFLEWGPAFAVRTVPASGPPEIHLSITHAAAGLVEVNAELTAGAAPQSLVVEKRAALNDAWQTDPASVQGAGPNRYRASVAPPAGARTQFYRLRAQ